MINCCGKDALLIPTLALEVEKWPIASVMEPVRAFPATGPPSPQNGMIRAVLCPNGHTDLSKGSC
jgi:hypothetical protein